MLTDDPCTFAQIKTLQCICQRAEKGNGKKTVTGRKERERGMKTERARGKGAESMLTSIQEEDILSFYAAHVIFIA